jgi:glutathione S-transferase
VNSSYIAVNIAVLKAGSSYPIRLNKPESAVLELYNAAVSTCSQRVRQALAEKNLEYVDRRLALNKGEHLTPEMLNLNPNGTVPTLVHDGKAIPDSSVIMEYLEDVFPQAPALRPRDAFEASRMRNWIQYIDEVQTPAVRYPSFQLAFGAGFRKLPREQLAGIAARKPIRKHFFLSMGPEGFPKDQLDAAMEQINQSFDRMEEALADGPWILGEMFSIVDISALPSIVRMEDLGLTELINSRSRLKDWYARCQQRPSFAKAYYPDSRDLSKP